MQTLNFCALSPARMTPRNYNFVPKTESNAQYSSNRKLCLTPSTLNGLNMNCNGKQLQWKGCQKKALCQLNSLASFSNHLWNVWGNAESSAALSVPPSLHVARIPVTGVSLRALVTHPELLLVMYYRVQIWSVCQGFALPDRDLPDGGVHLAFAAAAV